MTPRRTGDKGMPDLFPVVRTTVPAQTSCATRAGDPSTSARRRDAPWVRTQRSPASAGAAVPIRLTRPSARSAWSSQSPQTVRRPHPAREPPRPPHPPTTPRARATEESETGVADPTHHQAPEPRPSERPTWSSRPHGTCDDHTYRAERTPHRDTELQGRPRGAAAAPNLRDPRGPRTPHGCRCPRTRMKHPLM